MGQAYSYNATGHDPQNYALAFGLVTAPAGMSINAQTGTVRWTPTAAQIGSQKVVISLTDAAGLQIEQTFTLTATMSVAPPQITSDPPASGVVNQLYFYQLGVTAGITSVPGVGTPTAPQGLIYSLDMAPVGMTIDPAAGTIRWTPTDYGLAQITVQVTDILGQSATQTFNVNITLAAPPQPPVITTQPVTSAVEGIPYSQQITAVDPQAEPITYQLTNFATGMTIDPNTGLISFTPNGTGSITVTVVAEDTSGLYATLNYTLTIHSDIPPEIETLPTTSITAGLPYRYDIQADGNGDSLTYTLVQGPAGMTVDNLGRLTWPTTVTDAGTYPVLVDVTSGGGLTSPISFNLDVEPDTTPPTVVLRTDRAAKSTWATPSPSPSSLRTRSASPRSR